MEPILWVQPEEVWEDRDDPNKVHYILRGEGFERRKYVVDRPGYTNHDARLHAFLRELAHQNRPS